MKDWNRIRTEFLAGGVGYAQLAQKYGVSASAVSKRATAEGWRQQMSTAGRNARLERLSDEAVEKIERAMGELEVDFQKGERLETGLVDTSRLRQIIQSIKDLRDISGGGQMGKGDASRLYEALEREDV